MSDSDKQNVTNEDEKKQSDLIESIGESIGRWLVIIVIVFGGFGICKFFSKVSGLSKPPIEVTFRKSMIDGSRRVVSIRNYSDKAIAGYCTCEGFGGTTSSYNLALNPHQEVEIGWMQGWDFVPREKIVFHIEGYSVETYSVP